MKASPFLEKLKQLFDIPASDTYRKLCEATWNVKMSTADFAFYNNQKKTPPVGYCSSTVDRNWDKSMKRKEKRNNRTRNEQYDDNSGGVVNPSIENIGSEDVIKMDDDQYDQDFIDDVDKKLKRKYQAVIDDKDDDLPYKYRHIRHGLCSVRPQVYKVIKILQAKYHLSYEQAVGAIITISNILFGRENFGAWKAHEPNGVCDNNTMPERRNSRRTDSYIEVMALHSIAEEIMTGEDTCIVLSNDGSSQSGVGTYVVQSLIINGTPRCLPTMGVFTESRETLTELTKHTLSVICCIGVQVSRQ